MAEEFGIMELGVLKHKSDKDKYLALKSLFLGQVWGLLLIWLHIPGSENGAISQDMHAEMALPY